MRTFILTLPNVFTRYVISFTCIPWPFAFSSPFSSLSLLLLLSRFSSRTSPVHLQHPAYSSSRNPHLRQHLTASTRRRRTLPQQPNSTAAASRGTGLLPPQPTPAAPCGRHSLQLPQHPTASTHTAAAAHSSGSLPQPPPTPAAAVRCRHSLQHKQHTPTAVYSSYLPSLSSSARPLTVLSPYHRFTHPPLGMTPAITPPYPVLQDTHETCETPVDSPPTPLISPPRKL